MPNIRTLALDELGCRSKRSHGETGRVEQIRNGVANQGIVVDHEHDAVRIAHSLGAVTGKAKWNTAPRGWFLAAHSRPPCASMIDRQIGSPIPIPCGLVVKKGANNRSACLPASIPGPVSSTDTRSSPGFESVDRIMSRLGSSQDRPWTQCHSSPSSESLAAIEPGRRSRKERLAVKFGTARQSCSVASHGAPEKSCLR